MPHRYKKWRTEERIQANFEMVVGNPNNSSAAAMGARRRLAMKKIIRRLAGATALATLFVGTALGSAPLASAVQPRTVYFSTEAQCKAALPNYSGSFTRVIQGCTYAGGYFGPIKTSSGPYFLVYAVRS